jgi:hypothetical protein
MKMMETISDGDRFELLSLPSRLKLPLLCPAQARRISVPLFQVNGRVHPTTAVPRYVMDG